MLFIHPYKTIFFCFPIIVTCIVNISSTIKTVTVNEIRDFIYENYRKQVGFNKKHLLFIETAEKKIYHHCHLAIPRNTIILFEEQKSQNW